MVWVKSLREGRRNEHSGGYAMKFYLADLEECCPRSRKVWPAFIDWAAERRASVCGVVETSFCDDCRGSSWARAAQGHAALMLLTRHCWRPCWWCASPHTRAHAGTHRHTGMHIYLCTHSHIHMHAQYALGSANTFECEFLVFSPPACHTSWTQLFSSGFQVTGTVYLFSFIPLISLVSILPQLLWQNVNRWRLDIVTYFLVL